MKPQDLDIHFSHPQVLVIVKVPITALQKGLHVEGFLTLYV